MVSPKPVSIVASAAAPGLEPEPLGLVGPLPVKSQVAALTAISTADATDLATAIALVNATKAKVNAMITALKA